MIDESWEDYIKGFLERRKQFLESQEMKNCQGVEMSPRAERIYGWLQKHGTGLHPFSTDNCVQANWQKLCQLRDLLEKAQMEPTEEYLDKLTLQQVQDMAVDLANIMRRTPDRRVS